MIKSIAIIARVISPNIFPVFAFWLSGSLFLVTDPVIIAIMEVMSEASIKNGKNRDSTSKQTAAIPTINAIPPSLVDSLGVFLSFCLRIKNPILSFRVSFRPINF